MSAARGVAPRVLAVVLCGLLGACASSTGGRTTGTTTDAATTSASTSTSTTRAATTTTQRVPARVTLAFAGDVSFEPPRDRLLAEDPATVLAPIAGVLGDADLTVVNLETAITERGTPQPKAFTFRTTPDALQALDAAGVDVASLANNHGLDYGLVGVEDALAASEATGVPIIGIGRDETEALAPFTTTIRGHRVAVIGATQVLDGELIPTWTATEDHPGLASAKRVEPLLSAVRAARARADTLVVFLHWGIERHECPSTTQITLAEQLAEAGADVIVGGHAHRLQGAGRLGGAIVHYGLGNFVFYAGSAAAAETGVFVVTVGGGGPAEHRWIPARIGAHGVPSPLDGDDAEDAARRFAARRACTGLEP